MKNTRSANSTASEIFPPSATLARDVDEPPPSGPPPDGSNGAVLPLLDKQETSERGEVDNGVKRRENRKRTSVAIANKVRQFDPRRGQRMHECSEDVYRDICKGCGEEKFLRTRTCKDRFCPTCANKRSGKLARQYGSRIEKLIAAGRFGYHLVVTVKNTKELPDYTVFKSLIKRMRKHEFWKRFGGIIAGIVSVEVTKKRGGLFHPHFHVLMFTREPLPVLPDGQWTIAFNQAVSDVWRELTGGESYIVRGSEFDGDVIEMVKYVSKPMELAAMTPDELETLFNWTKGKRMVQAFGELYGMVDDDVEEQEKACACKSCGGTSFERTVMRFDRRHRRYVVTDVFDVEADVQDEADEQSTGPP